jgi:hypothetical protein
LEGQKYSMAHKQPGQIINGPPNNTVDTNGMLVRVLFICTDSGHIVLFLITFVTYRNVRM